MLEDLRIGRRYDGFLYLAEAARNPPKLKSHRHVELELNLVVRGSIIYVMGARRFTFESRTMLWLFPAQEHRLVDCSKDAQVYVAVFKPAIIARSCRTRNYAGLNRATYKRGDILRTQLGAESFDLVRKTMDSLMQESLDPDILNREAGFGVDPDFTFEHGDPEGLNAGLHHLLLLCWRIQRTGKALGNAVALHTAVRRALKLLSEGEWEHDLRQLARVCGVSETYLSRVFARQVGVPLNRYRNSIRLSRFLEIYRQPEQKTLAEAVYAAGFGSYAQFYKVFKQSYGSGPRMCLGQRMTLERSEVRDNISIRSLSRPYFS